MPKHGDFAKIYSNFKKQYGDRAEEVFHRWLNKYGLDDTKSLDSQRDKLKSEEKPGQYSYVVPYKGTIYKVVADIALNYISVSPEDNPTDEFFVQGDQVKEIFGPHWEKLSPEQIIGFLDSAGALPSKEMIKSDEPPLEVEGITDSRYGEGISSPLSPAPKMGVQGPPIETSQPRYPGSGTGPEPKEYEEVEKCPYDSFQTSNPDEMDKHMQEHFERVRRTGHFTEEVSENQGTPVDIAFHLLQNGFSVNDVALELVKQFDMSISQARRTANEVLKTMPPFKGEEYDLSARCPWCSQMFSSFPEMVRHFNSEHKHEENAFVPQEIITNIKSFITNSLDAGYDIFSIVEWIQRYYDLSRNEAAKIVEELSGKDIKEKHEKTRFPGKREGFDDRVFKIFANYDIILSALGDYLIIKNAKTGDTLGLITGQDLDDMLGFPPDANDVERERLARQVSPATIKAVVGEWLWRTGFPIEKPLPDYEEKSEEKSDLQPPTSPSQPSPPMPPLGTVVGGEPEPNPEEIPIKAGNGVATNDLMRQEERDDAPLSLLQREARELLRNHNFETTVATLAGKYNLPISVAHALVSEVSLSRAG